MDSLAYNLPLEYPLLSALLIGFLSTLHCLGMCGGIMGVLTFSLPKVVRDQPLRLGGYLLAYSIGRVGSYTVAGALVGSMGGALLESFDQTYGFIIIQGAAALLMAAIGLYLAGWFPRFAMIEKIGIPLWNRLEPIGRRLLPVSSPLQALLYGVIWGWLPCGLVYTALIWTISAGSALNGALFMLLFGVGTLPAVTSAGMLAGTITRYAQYPLARRIAGSMLIVMALVGPLVTILS
ncbi:hypothetical protein BOW53_00455 [Solemya pervernicosa gill symbiont]|uniref:Urease accessory protein UreH-like transmembrane domain-containing protein n=2 Tax=Gammaproteobacteria incertae sedis TaxID=118884 RepID=A0A1T2LBN0_9GAMM|nr:sulfite exporter TauE/SafE family protein [Candidatus Reidiella endopervernicosa]OOZ42346.1 hypothetical protein BOW53_00455 [Solemya pervernicosa gill symbiont]QKQ25734.1 sulfite exporter TauE/SafE family protein [Candidatus Reidiella endopervernicosa]